MTSAVGIHAHPTKKLGRRPADPRRLAQAQPLRLKNYLTGKLPTHPLVDPAPKANYPMDGNDQAGDCVVAGMDHCLQAQDTQLGVPRKNWTMAQILAYYQTQNPGFTSWSDGGGSNDGGMVVQEFLDYLVKQGVIVAFGPIDLTDEEEMKAAAWIGLAVVTGETLTVAQQNQHVWDYVPGDQVWGGHCTATVGYQANPDQQTNVTWGSLQQMTEAFVKNQVEEAWFVLTSDLIAHPSFRDGFDLPAFAQAVSDLTGGKVIVPVDPPVPPTPTPTPPGPSPLDTFPFQAMDLAANDWANHHHYIPTHTVRVMNLAVAAYIVWRQANPTP